MSSLLTDKQVCKQTTIKRAIAKIQDGATVMIGGFGSPGTPFSLIEALLVQGSSNLTLIKNDANEEDIGVDCLIKAGLVTKLVTTHLGLNRHALQKMNSGHLQVEFIPQGIFAERIRCAGSGLPAFLSDIALDTEIARPENLITFKHQNYQVEEALRADFALIHAHQADLHGNLRYRATARNFNPIMAMAADFVIAETANINSLALESDCIHTPSIFVNYLVHLPFLGKDYQLMEHHITKK